MSCLDKEIYDDTQVANLMRSHGMDFATIEKCLDFIRAEARAEALMKVEDLIHKWWFDDGDSIETLIKAIKELKP
jgi:UDP-2,3-diacylglucosamine pyrophosphatase LpxH